MHNNRNDITSLLFSLQNENKIKFEEKNQVKDDKQFSSLLKEKTEDASGKKDTKQADKLIHDESKAKENQEKVEKLAKSMQQNDFGLSSLLNYLYQLIIKNPDALSISEKQMIGIKDLDTGKVDTAKLRDMLSARGLNINDLNSKEVEKLIRMHDESQLGMFLDKLAREKKGIKTSASTMESKEKDTEKMNVFEKVKINKDLKREEVIKQVIDRILIRSVGAKDKEIVIRMNPEYLGQLKVILEVKDNKVSAKFETTSKVVKDIISGSEKELSEALKGQNLVLSGISAELVEEIA
ncbi:MAG: flagellar hook-length control protein FliK [Armatimonadota bacterium]